jgi:hypothetical protein
MLFVKPRLKMAHICPHCKSALAYSDVRSEFECKNCRRSLRSNRVTMLWVCGLAALVAEILIFFALSRAFGSYSEGAFAWTFVGGVGAIIIYWIVESFLVSVKVAVK